MISCSKRRLQPQQAIGSGHRDPVPCAIRPHGLHVLCRVGRDSPQGDGGREPPTSVMILVQRPVVRSPPVGENGTHEVDRRIGENRGMATQHDGVVAVAREIEKIDSGGGTGEP